MITLLAFLFSFYTQYKYANDINFILEDPISMALGGDHTLDMWQGSPSVWNPAENGNRSVGLSHFSYFGGFVNVENAGVSGITTGDYNLSFFISYIHSRPVELTSLIDTALGVTEDNIRIREEKTMTSLSIYGSAGKHLTQKLSWGIGFHFNHQKLPDYYLNDAGIDIGFIYDLNPTLYLGGNFKNVIATRIENTAKEILRPSAHFSAFTLYERMKYYLTLSTEYDGEKDYAFFSYMGVTLYASAGISYNVSEKIALRAGVGKYGMGLGTGINLGKLVVDYGLRPFSNTGITHKLAISYSLE